MSGFLGSGAPWLGLTRLGSSVFAQPATVIPFMHGVTGGLARC